MIVKEYGKDNKDVILLLHGGGLSWWNYKDEVDLLKDDYHLIIPILDGHSGSDKDFISISDTANNIIDYIDTYLNGHVKLIGGLSLGAQILLDILSKREDICEYAIIESALVIPMKTTNKLISPSINMSYGLISKKWFSKLQFKDLRIKEDLFDLYYEDTKNISKDNMISILKSNTSYTLNDSIKNNKAKSYVIVGKKERPIMIKSANIIHDTLPNSELEIIDNYYHGDLSINHADEYVNRIIRLKDGRIE